MASIHHPQPNTNNGTTVLDAALALHKAGYPVLPVGEDKYPLSGEGWDKERLADATEVRLAFAYPHVGVALALHHTDPPLLDIDGDGPGAEDALKELWGGDLPP